MDFLRYDFLYNPNGCLENDQNNFIFFIKKKKKKKKKFVVTRGSEVNHGRVWW
jgi:hypothetical protein